MIAEKKELFTDTMHPYTQALISAVPVPNPDYKKERIILQGDVPSPAKPPTGCRFHPRCSKMMNICSEIEPKLIEIKEKHFCACHLYNEK